MRRVRIAVLTIVAMGILGVSDKPERVLLLDRMANDGDYTRLD